MSTRFLPLLLTLSLLLLAGRGAFGGNLDDAKIAVHARPDVPFAKTCSQSPSAQGVPCSQFVTAGDVGAASTIYLAVAHVDSSLGVGGLSCGIAYDPVVMRGVDVWAWILCTDGLDFSNNGWPASGSGNRITWTTCPSGTVPGYEDEGDLVVFGAFYVFVYSEDSFAIVKNPLSPGDEDDELAAGSCAAVTSFLPLSAAGFVTFSPGATTEGCNPCLEPCAAEPPQPACLLTVSSLSLVGNDPQGSFDIQNTSDGVITGDVRLPVECTGFDILSGGGPFSLGPGEARTVTVECTSCTPAQCVLETGNESCAQVSLYGQRTNASCDLSTTEIDFGEVWVGGTDEATFTILNDDCATLSWSLHPECSVFQIVGGTNITPGTGGTWNLTLASGDSATVEVAFHPLDEGDWECALVVDGNGFDCGPLALTGAGVYPPCQPPFLVGQSLLLPTEWDAQWSESEEGAVRWYLGARQGEPFDVHSIVPSSLLLNGLVPAIRPVQFIPSYAGFDGEVMVVRFRRNEAVQSFLGAQAGAAQATLSGRFYNSTACLEAVGQVALVGDFPGFGSVVGVGEDHPTEFGLRILRSGQIGGGTRMEVSLPGDGPVDISVFDVSGRRVRELAREWLTEGRHLITWNQDSDGGTQVPSGIYFIKADIGGRVFTSRTVVIR